MSHARAPRIALLLLASGCHEVFTLEPPPQQGDTEFRLEHRRAFTGTSVDTRTIALEGAELLVRDTDAPGGFRVQAMQPDGAGAMTLVSTATRPLLRYRLPGQTLQRFVSLASPTVLVVDREYRRVDATPASPNAQLQLRVELDRPHAPTDQYLLFTVGAWSSYAVPHVPDASPWTPPPIPYAHTAPSGGPPHDRIRTDDPVFLVRFDAINGTTGVMRAMPFELGDAGVVDVAGAMQPVTQTTKTVQVDSVATAQRLGAVVPDADARSMYAFVYAAPALADDVYFGVPVAYAAGAPFDPSGVTLSYPDASLPGTDWPFSVTWTAGWSRPVSVAPAVRRGASLFFATDLASTTELAMTQPLPTAVSVAKTSLLLDGREVAIDRTAPVALEISYDMPPVGCDMHAFAIDEVDLASGARRRAAYALADTPAIEIPSDVFSPRAHYIVQAACFAGVPGIADGDTTTPLPYRAATLDSALFTTP